MNLPSENKVVRYVAGRDVDQAWNIMDMCAHEPGSLRENVVREIAHLLAEIRKLRRAK